MTNIFQMGWLKPPTRKNETPTFEAPMPEENPNPSSPVRKHGGVWWRWLVCAVEPGGLRVESQCSERGFTAWMSQEVSKWLVNGL